MEFSGKVAVVTGAGSGIGRGLATKAGQLGMKVVAADVDAKGLEATKETLSATGVEVLAQHTDVTDYSSVIKLADAAYAHFGRVNLLFNNAGVLVGGILWERSLEDWRWNLDVNVMGVIHGIKAFVPRMIAGGDEGIVVNTASVGGLSAGPFQGPYITSKYAVVGLTEVLQAELSLLHPKLRAACLFRAYFNQDFPFGTNPARQVWAGKGIVAENSFSIPRLAHQHGRGRGNPADRVGGASVCRADGRKVLDFSASRIQEDFHRALQRHDER